MARVIWSAETVTGAAETTGDDVRRWWGEGDPSDCAWVAVDPGGRMAAYADLARRTDERYAADGYVHSSFTARGLGRFIVELTEWDTRARGGKLLENTVMAKDTAALRLLASEGYEVARHFWRMTVDPRAPRPDPPWPEGLRLGTPKRSQMRAVHAAIIESFTEEYGFVPEAFEDWIARKDSQGFDPALCFTAWEGDEVVGVAQCSHRYGAGWVNALAVRPPWRRRGLGHALLTRAFEEMARRGEQRVALGVDAANPTGATRLYERAGMHVEFEAVTHIERL